MSDDDKPTSRRGRPLNPDRLSSAERKRISRENAEKDGLARVEVLVPRDKVQDVRNYAARLRAEAEAGNNSED